MISQSDHTGIEMERVAVGPFTGLAHNRTILELKLTALLFWAEWMLSQSDHTGIEMPHYDYRCHRGLSHNRTILELKFRYRNRRSAPSTLTIGPYWN